MVRAARELESKYSDYGACCCWDHGDCMEYQCGAGNERSDAGERTVLPKSIVSTILCIAYCGCSRADTGFSCQLEQADYRA